VHAHIGTTSTSISTTISLKMLGLKLWKHTKNLPED
jgi:hypothetical protein